MPDFRLGGVLGANADNPALATESMLQGLGLPLRKVDLGALSPVGYGGITNFVQTALSDIDATPQVLPALAGSVTAPVDITQDVANDALIFLTAGVWQVSVGFGIQFGSENFGRNVQTQVYNQQDDAVFVSSSTAIGRNQEGANIATTLLLDLLPEDVGQRIQIRVVSAADTFTGVLLDTFTYSAVRLATAAT